MYTLVLQTTWHTLNSRMKNEKIVWLVGRYALLVHFDMNSQAQKATNAKYSGTSFICTWRRVQLNDDHNTHCSESEEVALL